jgi:hypothetical protein
MPILVVRPILVGYLRDKEDRAPQVQNCHELPSRVTKPVSRRSKALRGSGQGAWIQGREVRLLPCCLLLSLSEVKMVRRQRGRHRLLSKVFLEVVYLDRMIARYGSVRRTISPCPQRFPKADPSSGFLNTRTVVRDVTRGVTRPRSRASGFAAGQNGL